MVLAAGLKTGGVVVNTNNFGLTPSNSFQTETIRNKVDYRSRILKEYDDMYDAIALC